MSPLPTLDELRQILATDDRATLRDILEDAHPFDVAELFEQLDDTEMWQILRAAPAPQNAEIVAHLDLDDQKRLIEAHAAAEPQEAARLVAQMAPDDRTDLIQALDEPVAEQVLNLLPEPAREVTERLTTYPEGSVGAVMSTDFAALPEDLTVNEAIDLLRLQAPRKETIYYAYVMDEQTRLKGLVSLKDLILADADQRVSDVMQTEVVSIGINDSDEEAARLIQEYDLIALPVIDTEGKLVGIVTVDDVMDVTEEEATEDFHKMGSVATLRVGPGEASWWMLFSRRAPWLLVLVFINMFAGEIIEGYEEMLAAVTALIAFMPLLIDSAGNAGSQSATLMVRALATGEVMMKDWFKLIGKELYVAVTLGVAMAIAVSLVGLYRAPDIIPVIALTMVLVVVMGSVIGMSLPFLLARLGLDPATASAPLITSVADICGVFIYLAIAAAMLELPEAPPQPQDLYGMTHEQVVEKLGPPQSIAEYDRTIPHPDEHTAEQIEHWRRTTVFSMLEYEAKEVELDAEGRVIAVRLRPLE